MKVDNLGKTLVLQQPQHGIQKGKALVIWSIGTNPMCVFLLITQLTEEKMFLFRKQSLSCPRDLAGNR